MQLCLCSSLFGRCGRILALFGEVLACAEGFVAGAGDDGDEEGGLVVEPGEDGVGVPVGVGGDGVALFGAVDGDEEDVGFGEGEDEVVARWWYHCSVLLVCSVDV